MIIGNIRRLVEYNRFLIKTNEIDKKSIQNERNINENKEYKLLPEIVNKTIQHRTNQVHWFRAAPEKFPRAPDKFGVAIFLVHRTKWGAKRITKL